MNDINCSEQYLMNQPKLTTFLLLETESNSLTGLVGFEPTTYWLRANRSTWLSHRPTALIVRILNIYSISIFFIIPIIA